MTIHLESIYQLGTYYWVNIMRGGVQLSEVKRTYSQDWRAYNAAQTTEKDHFLRLLHNLCSNLEDPIQTKGRPRIPNSDAIFAVCYKIYSGFSGRRFMSDLRHAHSMGYISRAVHYNSIFNYLENPSLTPILESIITKTSLPLTAVEEDFAADSSGFTAAIYDRWYEHKYGKQQKQKWVKAHVMCGVKTNIVTAVTILDQHTNDAVPFGDLVEATAKNFTMKEVSADKAYVCGYNFKIVEKHGATPFISFKINNKLGKTLDIWTKMYHYFHLRHEEFMEHYHKRSNVETTFSMIKAKFGGYVRSKTETAMKNEVLAKIVCHNICVLIQETHELGIDINFP